MDGSPEQTPPPSPFRPTLSIPAVAATALLVASAVLFGIFGPPVAGRLGLGGGIPIVELVDAAAALYPSSVLDTIDQGDASDLASEEARGLVRQLVGRSMVPPDLSDAGFRLRRVGPVSLPGAAFRGAVAVYQGTGAASPRWILLFLVADDGQYLSFDAMGRPRPMPTGRSFDEPLPGRGRVAVAWSDGQLLRLALFDTEADAEVARGPLGAP